MIPENYAQLSGLRLRSARLDGDNCDFRAAKKANRQAGPAYAAIYVHLRTAFPVPAREIRSAILGQPERMNKRNVDLAAVRMAGKNKVHVAYDVVKIARRVKDRDFVSVCGNAGKRSIQAYRSTGRIIQADEPDIGTELNIRIHEQMNARVFVELMFAVNRVNVVIIFPVAAHNPNTEGSVNLPVDLLDLLPSASVTAKAVACDHDDVRLLGVENGDHLPLARAEAVRVKIGQLRDPQRSRNGSLKLIVVRLNAVRLDKGAVDEQPGDKDREDPHPWSSP